MKRHNNAIKFLSLFLIGAFLFSSCSDWFDESPKTDLKADKMFENEEGFQNALTGIYLLLTSANTYAGNMSFGLLDQLAQEYDYVPDGVQDINAIYNYKTSTTNGYQSKQKITASWQAMYNVIANCNNLIKWLDKRGTTVVTDEQERNMLRGEALAIRAFCHFDLLRAWGPWNYRNNAKAAATETIPYRTVADNSKQPRLAAKEVLNRIEKDLLAARDLLAYEKDVKLKGSDRRYRFNYHAITALLARVYGFMGAQEKAVELAKEVISKSGLELQTTNQNDPILFSECICGLNMYQMEDGLSSRWAIGDKFTTQYVISQKKFDALFEVSGSRRDDMRSKTSAFYTYDTQQLALSKKYNTNQKEVIPLIRLPEMYYILCEFTTDNERSRSYLNYVRNRRGYSAALNEKYTDMAGRLKALDKEYRKEYYGEGQYWYFLKAHGYTSIPYAADITLTEERYVFPLPDAEVQYGWVESETASN
ncbi:RagB/SusD family nutrient uptake outer membrane protein [Prevotella sp.]|uniref:RagB/SusD family nutrient uptake outer membrane protein n=1 Tax=Prevotella sp. TaxID=59823 RepID=UPI002F92FDBF